MARPSTQQQRRQEIHSAAQRVLLRKKSVTSVALSDIADELGVTPNAVRYYYRNIGELLDEMHRRASERFYTRRAEAIEDVDDAREKLAVTIQAGLPSGPDDAEWRLMWQVLIANGIESGGAALMSEVYEEQVQLYVAILVAGVDQGHFALRSSVEHVARTLLSLEDYLGFRVIARDPAIDRDLASDLLREYAELATGSVLPLL